MKRRHRAQRWLRVLAGAVLAAAAQLGGAAEPLAQGIVWQIDNEHVNPYGNWQQLGVQDLLVQWTAVDNTAFVSTPDIPAAPHLPDWPRIAREPWAHDVIVGLAGSFSETTSRSQAIQLVELSAKLVRYTPPVHIVGWYFPVEIDPSWHDAKTLRSVLCALPRPLWVSVYDRTNIGGAALADWLNTWLPSDVGVLFQDGCGVYAREAPVARAYADVLSAKLGAQRVRLIAEAFRPAQGGGFRPATAAELAAQLAYYHGYRTYLFDGPHYVSDELVHALLAQPHAAASKPNAPAPAER
jgi:hypothetical protein